MKYGAVAGQIGAADKAAKEASMHLDGYPLALDGIDFGEQPQDAGRFWAVAPDWMHVYYEGIGKDLLDWIVGLCKVYFHVARFHYISGQVYIGYNLAFEFWLRFY